MVDFFEDRRNQEMLCVQQRSKWISYYRYLEKLQLRGKAIFIRAI